MHFFYSRPPIGLMGRVAVLFAGVLGRAGLLALLLAVLPWVVGARTPTRAVIMAGAGPATGPVTGRAYPANPVAVNAAAPTVSSFTPARGAVGSLITLTGTDFLGATAVRFGTINTPSFTVVSNTMLTVTVPAGVVLAPLTVLTPDGASRYVGTGNGLFAVPACTATVQVTPAGPLVLPSGGSALLTATATTPGFNGGFDVGSQVASSVVQPDGKVLVGGIFTTYYGLPVSNNVLRLNADGSLDTSFNPGGTGTNSGVVMLAIQPDGKVLVGGGFTSYNGNANAPDNILRLNADGSLDTGFNNGAATGTNSFLQTLAVQPDGKILVGGFFTSYNGNANAPDNVLRLNADGSLDTGFNPGGTGTSDFVYMVTLQPDGKILVGGIFTSYNGNAAAPDRVLRLNADGSLDTGFNNGAATGADSDVNALAVQADGKVLVGGSLTSYNGNAAAPDNVLRLNADGSLDTGFNNGGTGVDDFVRTLAVQPDGKVLVGGFFVVYNGTTFMRRMLRLNADGSLNNAATPLAGATFVFNPGNTSGPTRTVTAAGSYTATATDPATGCVYTSNTVVVSAAALAPVITSLMPNTGPVGSPFNIVGTGLTGTTAVTFTSSSSVATTVPSGFVVANDGSITGVTVPAGLVGGTYTVTVTTPGGTSNGLAFEVYRDLIISTPGQTIAADTYRNITITGTGVGSLPASGTVTVTGAFVVQGGGRFNVGTGATPVAGTGTFALQAGGYLYAALPLYATGAQGAIQVGGSRTFASAAAYEFGGSATATGPGLPGTVTTLVLSPTGMVQLTQPVAIGRELRLSTGTLNLNGQGLTLLSDATTTAQVNQDGVATTGTVTGGSATVQRYIAANGNSGLGYRHLSSPVSGNRLDDLAVPGGFQPIFNPAYNSNAASGSITPFPNVFGFDPARVGVAVSSYSGFDQGYFSPVTSTVPDLFVPGRGYSVNLTAGQTVDFVGPLIQTDVVVPLARAAGSTSPDDSKGWQLLGNPFASSFALASLDNTPGVDNAKYIFQSTGPYTGSYQTVLTGLTGQPLLAVGQGFFARVSTPGTVPTLTFAQAGRRVDFSANSAFHRSATETRPLLELALTNAAGTLRDGTTLYADAQATAGFDKAYDAVKLPNPQGLNLWQEAGGMDLAVNGRPTWLATSVVPLTVGVPAAGTYYLQVSQLLNLPAGMTAVLVDAQQHTQTDLATLPATGYAFTLSAGQAATALRGRFWLNLGPDGALATAAGQAAPGLQLYPNPAHAAATLVGATPGIPVQVLDALGRLVLSAVADARGQVSLPLPAGLAGGMYVVRAGARALRLTVE